MLWILKKHHNEIVLLNTKTYIITDELEKKSQFLLENCLYHELWL